MVLLKIINTVKIMSGIIKVGIDMKKLGGFINEKGYLNLDLFVDDKASEYNTNVKVQNSLSKEDRDAKVEPITAGSGRVVFTKDGVLTALPFVKN
jgi:hypothetical protein